MVISYLQTACVSLGCLRFLEDALELLGNSSEEPAYPLVNIIIAGILEKTTDFHVLIECWACSDRKTHIAKYALTSSNAKRTSGLYGSHNAIKQHLVI